MYKKNIKKSGIAWGKIILMGEHSVVYGKPAIAIPFKTLKAISTVEWIKGGATINTDYYKGDINKASNEIAGLITCIKATISELKVKCQDFKISINSTIPKERGMGSSAAVAVSSIKALFNYFNKNLTKEKLLEITNIAETINHGKPSGIDAAVTSGNHPIYYVKGESIKTFPLKLTAYLVVADSGTMSQTKRVVLDVNKMMLKDQKKTSLIIAELGNLAAESKYLIEINNFHKLGKNMTQAHRLLNKLSVSNDLLDRLVNCALEQGALGAKLTGGGRGGCIIALASSIKDAEKISRKLKENGAINTWIYNMEDE